MDKKYEKIYKDRQQEMATRLDKLTRKDEAWFWEATRKQLRWYSYKFTQKAEEMDEITDLTINKIIIHWKTYDPTKALFTSWAHRILHNIALQWLHDKMKIEKVSTRIDGDDEWIEIIAEEEDDNPNRVDILHEKIIEEIEKLSPKLKPIAIRYMLEGEKQEDISKELGINLNTIKTRVRQSKEIISKNILKKHSELVY